MALDRKQLIAIGLLALVMVFWAGNAIVGRAVRDDIPPFTLSLIRWVGAVSFVLPFAILSLRKDWPELRRRWRETVVLGLLGVGAFNALLYWGLHYTTATNTLLLIASVPALVVVFDRLIFGTRSPVMQVAGTFVSMLGAAVVVLRGDLGVLLALELGRGDLLILTAVFVWALYTVLLRVRPKVAPVSLIAATFLIGALAMVPLAAWEFAAGEHIVWSWPAAGALLYVSLLPSLAAFFIYNWAAQVLGPAHAGLAVTLLPVFGGLLSALVLGEALFAYHAVGIVLIVVGIALAGSVLARKTAAGATRGQSLED